MAATAGEGWKKIGKKVYDKMNQPIPQEVSNPLKAKAEKDKKALVFNASPQAVAKINAKTQKGLAADKAFDDSYESTPEATKKVGVGVFRFIKELAVAPVRTAIGLDQSLKKNITGEPVKPYRPKSKVGRFLLEPSDDYEGVKPTEETIDKVYETGKTLTEKYVGKEYGKGGGLFGSAVLFPVLSAVDFSGTGGAKKKVQQKLEKEAAELALKVEAENLAETTAKKLFNGSEGKVTEVENTFKKVLELPNDQHTVIRELAEQGDEAAAKIIEEPKDFYQKADQLMREKYGKEYDAIKYKNEQMPAKGVEFHDLKDGKFYSEQKATAEAYALQNRGGKYKVPPPDEVVKDMETLASQPEKQKKFLESVLDSDTASPALKEQVAKISPQTYKPVSNQSVLDKATALIDSNYDDAVKKFKESSPDDEVGNVLGQVLAQRADAVGHYDEAIDIIKTLDERARASGRAVQVFSLWNRLSPEGMIRFAQREVEKANKDAGLFEKMFGKGKGKLELNPEDAEFISKKMRAAQALPPGAEKDALVREAMEYINEKIPPSMSELFDAWRYQNILSNPRTQLRNIYGNAFQTMITKPATMAYEAPVDWIKSITTGSERTRYVADVPRHFKAVFNAIPNGIEAFAQSWKGKIDMNFTAPDLNQMRLQGMPKALTVVSRLMEGADQFFKSLVSSSEYANLIKRGVPEATARAEADKAAQYSLFRAATDSANKTGQGKVLSSIDGVTDWIAKGRHLPGIGKPMSWFVPFLKTPMNVAKQWIEYSPLGVSTLIKNDKKATQIAKTLLGSTVFLYGAKKAAEGDVTWSAPTNPDSKAAFYASGRKPYSVRIGDKWVPLIYFGPFALSLALPAAYEHHTKESNTALTDSQLEKSVKVITSGLEFFSQQTFLEGMGTFVKMISGDPDYKLPNTLAFTSEQALPLAGLVRYINANFVDPVFRDAKGFKESLMKDIPFLSTQLDPIKNAEGEIQERELKNAFTPYDIGTHVEEYNRILKLREKSAQKKNLFTTQADEAQEAEKKKIDGMSPEARIEYIKEIASTDPEKADTLIERLIDDAERVEPEIKFYKTLGVSNGLRASVVKDELDSITDPQARAQRLAELVKQKVVTDAVLDQIIELSTQQ